MSLKILLNTMEKATDPNKKKVMGEAVEYVDDLDDFQGVLTGKASSRYTYGLKDDIPMHIGAWGHFIKEVFHFDEETQLDIINILGDKWDFNRDIYTNVNRYKEDLIKYAMRGSIDKRVDIEVSMLYSMVSKVVKAYVEFHYRSKEDLKLVDQFQELIKKVGKLHDFPPEYKDLYKGKLVTRISKIMYRIKKRGSKGINYVFLYHNEIVHVSEVKKENIEPFTIEKIKEIYEILNTEYETMKEAIQKQIIDAEVSKEQREEWLATGKLKHFNRSNVRDAF